MLAVFLGLRKGYHTPFVKKETVRLSCGVPWFAYGTMMEASKLETGIIEKEKTIIGLFSTSRKLEGETKEAKERLSTLDEIETKSIIGPESRITTLDGAASSACEALTVEQSKAHELQEECTSLREERDTLRGELTLARELLDKQKKASAHEADTHRRISANMDAAISHQLRSNVKLKDRVAELEQSLRATTENSAHYQSVSVDIIKKFDVLSLTFSALQSENTFIEEAEAAKAEDAIASAALRAALTAEQEKTRALEAQLRYTGDLLHCSEGRESHLHSEVGALKVALAESTKDEDISEDQASDDLDISRFAVELEKELLETQLEEEVTSHAETKAAVDRLAVQLDTALSEAVRLRSQLETALLDLAQSLDANTSLSTANTSLGTAKAEVEERLADTEATLNQTREYAHTLILQRNRAQQMESQYQRHLDAKAADEEKIQFLIAELNKEKRELSMSKRSVEDALAHRVRRCEELEKENAALAAKLEVQTSRAAASHPVTPQSKGSLANKENSMSGTTRLFSKLSGMRRQNSLPLSNSTIFNTPTTVRNNVFAVSPNENMENCITEN